MNAQLLKTDLSNTCSRNGKYGNWIFYSLVMPLGGLMRELARFRSFLLVALILLLGAGAVSADTGPILYPKHTNDYINDFAGILTPQERKVIETQFKKLERQTGIEAVVVTIDRLSDYNMPDNNIEAFATNLFNKWGIGHKKSNDGVLFLIAVKSRMVRIELGGAYARRYDSRMQRVLDEIVLPNFRAGQLSQGIILGAAEIEKEITVPVSWFEFHKWHILISGFAVALIVSGIFLESRGKRGLFWLCFGALLLLIGVFFSALFGKSSGGFGGGSSGGGGATGRW
jgi:uncharacterized protein